MDTLLAVLSKLGYVGHTWLFPTLAGIIFTYIVEFISSRTYNRLVTYIDDYVESEKLLDENNQEGETSYIHLGTFDIRSVLSMVLKDKAAALDIIFMNDVMSSRLLTKEDFKGKKFRQRVIFFILAILTNIFPIIFAGFIPSEIGYTYISSRDRVVTQQMQVGYMCEESTTSGFLLSYNNFTGNSDISSDVIGQCINVGITTRGNLFAICLFDSLVLYQKDLNNSMSIAIASSASITHLGYTEAVNISQQVGLDALPNDCLVGQTQYKSNNTYYLQISSNLRSVAQIAYTGGQENYAVILGFAVFLTFFFLLMIIIIVVLCRVWSANKRSSLGLRLAMPRGGKLYSQTSALLMMLMHTRAQWCYEDLMDITYIRSMRRETSETIHYDVNAYHRQSAVVSKMIQQLKSISLEYTNDIGLLKYDKMIRDQEEYPGLIWDEKEVGIKKRL
jgi:hypothetical protein